MRSLEGSLLVVPVVENLVANRVEAQHQAQTFQGQLELLSTVLKPISSILTHSWRNCGSRRWILAREASKGWRPTKRRVSFTQISNDTQYRFGLVSSQRKHCSSLTWVVVHSLRNPVQIFNHTKSYSKIRARTRFLIKRNDR